MVSVKLLSNWQKILQRAWSIRLMLIEGLFSGLEVAVPLLQGVLPIHPGLFAALSLVAVMGAFVTRLLVQRGTQIAATDEHDGVGA